MWDVRFAFTFIQLAIHAAAQFQVTLVDCIRQPFSSLYMASSTVSDDTGNAADAEMYLILSDPPYMLAAWFSDRTGKAVDAEI